LYKLLYGPRGGPWDPGAELLKSRRGVEGFSFMSAWSVILVIKPLQPTRGKSLTFPTKSLNYVKTRKKTPVGQDFIVSAVHSCSADCPHCCAPAVDGLAGSPGHIKVNRRNPERQSLKRSENPVYSIP